jgi:hypothetical protein
MGVGKSRTLPGKLRASVYTPRWRAEEIVDVVPVPRAVHGLVGGMLVSPGGTSASGFDNFKNRIRAQRAVHRRQSRRDRASDTDRPIHRTCDLLLKGAKVSDLPVEQTERIRLVVNLKTAKTFGLTIPQSILLRADEVIK